MRDLGLTYEAAAHGVQSAIRFEMTQKGHPEGLITDALKHLRTGLDCRASDAWGLADLLIRKGFITREEYIENMRLAMNEELARYQDHCRREYGLPAGAEFR